MREAARCPAWTLGLLLLATVPGGLLTGPAHGAELPSHLRDRGPGLATSMFGTYIERGQLLIYPFFEHYRDRDVEYKPSELGFGLEQDFRGKFRASEGVLFLGYGLTDRVALEFEAAVITARQEKAPADPSAVPAVIEESGTGDVEGQIRLRVLNETDRRPELFAYLEAVSPQQRDKLLIGTPDWEIKPGVGVIRGNAWGTLTARVAGEYSAETSEFDLGEYALEYLKRLSPRWRVYAGLEGSQDELSLITEAQVRLAPFAVLKLNNGLGITSKATDWGPEVGVLFALPAPR